MGDYVLGYVRAPAFPIVEAVAASAAFPAAIGPLVLRTRDYTWWRYPSELDELASADPDAASARDLCPAPAPPFTHLHLWDAGVYDNLGVEQLFKGDRFRDGLNFLIVSDASAGLGLSRLDALVPGKRLIGIATDQVRGLRARMIVNYFWRHPGSGVYLRIGNTPRRLVDAAWVDPAQHAALLAAGLPEDEARQAASLGTHLKQLPPTVFDRLCRHGWEVADGTLSTRCGAQFAHRPWSAAWPC